MTNPYSTPRQTGAKTTNGSRVNGPAIALIVVASIAVALGVLGLIADVLFVVTGTVERLEAINDGPISKQTQITIRILWGILLVAASSFVLYGGIQMKGLRNYGLAKAAAIVAVIPMVGPCCLLGIPFGIWAFITLNDPAVKNAFTS